jgi:hypothetical protein
MRQYHVFAYDSDGYLYCEACAAQLRLPFPRVVFRDATFDAPEHCKRCGEFLENDLTPLGRENLTNAICNFEFELDPDRFNKYFDCYGDLAVIPTFAGMMNASGALYRTRFSVHNVDLRGLEHLNASGALIKAPSSRRIFRF